MDVKGKIEIIIKEKEDEVKVERVTADWDEVIESMASASSGMLLELIDPDKIEIALIAFCAHIAALARTKKKSFRSVEGEERNG